MCSKPIAKLTTVACASMFALSLSAAILTPEQALERALPAARRIAPAAGQNLQLAYTEKFSADLTPALYVFSRKGQYFVVSASDNADAVLGYADATFNPDNIPPALSWWLEQYALQIEAAEQNGVSAKAPLKANRTAIAPMLTTSWNQDSPFNDMCPVISGERSMTGCVATAMAQVMKYHKWPVTGTGSNSYRQGLKNISFNFGNTTFDWNNMLDYYTGNETEEQKKAVATLSYGAGVSVNMSYSPIASGASDVTIQKGLVEYLNYDKGIYYYVRDNYTIAEWEDIIYKQLTDYGPVLYSGQSNEGGHEFVCDGYNNDGFFHFNWGWGGMSDGYFRLTALDPGQQGIGGSLSGFNYSQAIVANVCRPREGSPEKVKPNLMLNGDLTLPSTGRTGALINVKGDIVNYSYLNFHGMFGLKSVNEETGKVIYTPGAQTNASGLPMLSYYTEYSLYLPSVISGKFTISLAYRDEEGNWYDMPGNVNAITAYHASVTGGRFTFTPISGGSIEVKSLDLATPFYVGQDFRLDATAVNTGDIEYNAVIMPALLDSSDKIIAYGSNLAVHLAVGESKSIEYCGGINNYPDNKAPQAGDYRLCFVNARSRVVVSDIIDVTLKSTSSPRLSISNFRLEGDSKNANAADLNFKARVTCMGGFFGGRLQLAIFPSANDYSVAVVEGSPMFISVLRSADFDVKCTIPNPIIGNEYLAIIYYNNAEPVSNTLAFTVTSNETNGISTPEMPEFNAYPNPTSGMVYFSEPVTEAEVYSLSGALMQSTANATEIDIEALPAGIYLLRAVTESNAGTPVVKRIVKK